MTNTVPQRTAAALRALADAVEKEDVSVILVNTEFANQFNANGQPTATWIGMRLVHLEATAKTMEAVVGIGKAVLIPDPITSTTEG